MNPTSTMNSKIQLTVISRIIIIFCFEHNYLFPTISYYLLLELVCLVSCLQPIVNSAAISPFLLFPSTMTAISSSPPFQSMINNLTNAFLRAHDVSGISKPFSHDTHKKSDERVDKGLYKLLKVRIIKESIWRSIWNKQHWFQDQLYGCSFHNCK